MDSSFGKMSLQKKVMRLKYRKDIPLQQAWDEVLGKKKTKTTKRKTKVSKSPKKKLTKSKLNQLSFETLKKLAKKYKVSCCRKGSKKLIKKSTLIKRLMDSKHSKKILEAAHKKRKVNRKYKFGNPLLNLLPKNNQSISSRPGIPPLNSWLDVTGANTPAWRSAHYASLPTTFLSFNKVSNVHIPKGGLSPSQAPYGKVKFGQYFH